MPSPGRFLFLVFALVLVACKSSPDVVQIRLNDILQSDLDYILNEFRGKPGMKALSANPHYVIDEFKEFQGDTSRVFQAYASVYFFYLESLGLCQNRKYRYRTTAKIWERYEVKLLHIPDKFLGKLEN